MSDDKEAEIAALKARLEALEQRPAEPAAPPPPAKESSGCGQLIFWTVAILAAVALFVGFAGQLGKTDADRAAERQQDEDYTYLARAKIALEATLRDPASVQYEDVAVVRQAGNPYVCGHYNAKNGFGGYVGRKPFLWAESGLVRPDLLGEERFSKEWFLRCR